MSISTTIPKTAGRRRSHWLTAITAVVAVIALAVATYAVRSATRSARPIAPTQASVLSQLPSVERAYVLGITSLTPVEVGAAFGTSGASAQGGASGSGAHAARSGEPTLSSVLRSLTPRERRYVRGIVALSPLQLWAAFGTSPTPPAARGGAGSTTAFSATASPSIGLPILPACRPGPCWHTAPSNASGR